jgi:hypothetical protein
MTAPLPTLRNKVKRHYPGRSPVIRCKEHAKTFLLQRGYKVEGVYWVESAGDSGNGCDTIGYVGPDGPRRAFLAVDPKTTRQRVTSTAKGWE